MTQIIDISPTRSNTNAWDTGHSVIGRMLSIACSPDGQVLYAGSYSNLWCSVDGGQTWEQLTWPQPDTSQFDVPGALGGWCALDVAVTLGWRVERHPRFLAKLTKRGFADIVGFGDCGVWTAVGNGDGSFQPPKVVIPNFGYQAGGWQVDKHPRFLVDLNNDGRADIVGFGEDGVWTAISKARKRTSKKAERCLLLNMPFLNMPFLNMPLLNMPFLNIPALRAFSQPVLWWRCQ